MSYQSIVNSITGSIGQTVAVLKGLSALKAKGTATPAPEKKPETAPETATRQAEANRKSAQAMEQKAIQKEAMRRYMKYLKGDTSGVEV